MGGIHRSSGDRDDHPASGIAPDKVRLSSGQGGDESAQLGIGVVTVIAAARVDLCRSRWSLLTEIALLRHQLTVLERSVARPHVTRLDRIVLVALAAITPTWRNVLRVVQPETLLRWHRAGFKVLWRWRSRPGPTLRIAAETVALIRTMARENALWGGRADSRRIAQARYQSQQAHGAEVHARGATASAWRAALVHVSAKPCRRRLGLRFLQAYDLFFRPIFALVFTELGHAQRRVRRNDPHAVTSWCLTAGTCTAWSPSTSATSTPHALTRASGKGPRCPRSGRRRARSSRSQCSAGFIMTTDESRETHGFGPIGKVANTGADRDATCATDSSASLPTLTALLARLVGSYRRRRNGVGCEKGAGHG